MTIDPSEIVYFQWGFIKITATLLFTWIVMFVLVFGSIYITRNIGKKADVLRVTRAQNISEAVITTVRKQIREVSQEEPGKYLPFIGTIFIFILFSNIISIIPGFISPTSSLNTTTALAICVFFAVPFYGIESRGIGEYLKQYIKPNVIMLPFNIIGEISRTLALAVRLYGNIMSSGLIVIILLGILPIFFPVLVHSFGLLMGAIQAYVFAILSIVYIASATKSKPQSDDTNE